MPHLKIINARQGYIQKYEDLKRKLQKKVKESRNRPGVAQKAPRCLGSQIFKTLGTLRW